MRAGHFKSKEAYEEHHVKGDCFKPKDKFPHKLRMIKPKKAQLQIMVGLLLGFMVVTIMVTLIPGFVEMFDTAQNAENLNCKGYTDTTNTDLSYNATVGSKSTIGCLAIKLYIPYIVLAVLIGLVIKILYGQATGQQSYGQYNPYG